MIRKSLFFVLITSRIIFNGAMSASPLEKFEEFGGISNECYGLTQCIVQKASSESHTHTTTIVKDLPIGVKRSSAALRNGRLGAKKQKTRIPATVRKWLDAQLSQEKKKPLKNYKSERFFKRDTSRLVGYIKGYNRSLGFSTGLIHIHSEITREHSPVVITIHEDGRFEGVFQMSHPKYNAVQFSNKYIRFYLEPGQILSMVFDWNELSKAKGNQFRLAYLQYGGRFARLNEELQSVALQEDIDYRALVKDVQNLTPSEFKSRQLISWNHAEVQLEKVLKEKQVTQQAGNILRNDIALSNATLLFEYARYRAVRAFREPDNEFFKTAIDTTYFDFLQKLSLNDSTLLIPPSFSTFINRFEYSDAFLNPGLLMPIRKALTPRLKSFDNYLFSELNLKATAEDRRYISFKGELEKKIDSPITEAQKRTILKELYDEQQAFERRYSQYLVEYKTKYPEVPITTAEMQHDAWNGRDSALVKYYKLQPNLVYELAKVRSLKFLFDITMKEEKKDVVYSYLTSFKKGINTPFLRSESERLFNELFPDIPQTSYDLPPGKGSEIFRKYIGLFQGKTIVAGFWTTSCGNSIASIRDYKVLREKYENCNEIEFIFFTSEDSSPLASYNSFVKEQGLKHTYRLPNDDFQYLKELFKIATPHYAVISKKGQVLSDDFEMFNFDSEIKKLLSAN